MPEHDVDLVDEPPELEVPPSFFERLRDKLLPLDDRLGVRVAFFALLVSASLYALAGIVSNFLYAMVSIREWRADDAIQLVQDVGGASFAVGLGSFGVLAGSLLLAGYLSMSVRDSAAWDPPRVAGRGVMRLLLALAVVFTLLWIGTRIATSWENGEFRANPSFYFSDEDEEPSGSLVALYAIQYASFAGAAGSIVLMGAGLMVQAHTRLGNPEQEKT